MLPERAFAYFEPLEIVLMRREILGSGDGLSCFIVLVQQTEQAGRNEMSITGIGIALPIGQQAFVVFA